MGDIFFSQLLWKFDKSYEHVFAPKKCVKIPINKTGSKSFFLTRLQIEKLGDS